MPCICMVSVIASIGLIWQLSCQCTDAILDSGRVAMSMGRCTLHGVSWAING
jgi:hypothetical protein